MTEEEKVFSKGDTVPVDGHYVCSPCGFKKEHKSGEIFGECTSCLAGTEDGNEDYVEGTGLWEKVEPIEEE